MEHRINQLRTRLAAIATRIEMLKSDVSRHRSNGEMALLRRTVQPTALMGAEATASAIAAEIEGFYALVAANADLPGVRDGQFNGIGTLLDGMARDCARAVAAMQSVRNSVAA